MIALGARGLLVRSDIRELLPFQSNYEFNSFTVSSVVFGFPRHSAKIVRTSAKGGHRTLLEAIPHWHPQ